MQPHPKRQCPEQRQRWLDESQLDGALTWGRQRELNPHLGHAQQDAQDPDVDEYPTSNQVSITHIAREGVPPSKIWFNENQ